MSESPPIAAPTLTNRQTMGWWVVGMTAFHAAYFWESAGILIVLYLAAMFYLPHISSTRSAFYVGFLTGYAVCVPHLFFLLDVFGAAAIGLWGVFAIWFALYLLLGRMILTRWPEYGRWLLPCLWMALEFFRSELYALRFSWLIPGFAISHPWWSSLAFFGVYGFSFLVMLAIAVLDRLPHWWRIRWFAVCVSVVLGLMGFSTIPQSKSLTGPLVVGMQMESPTESQVLSGLDEMIEKHPQADLLFLSEYTFDGPVPEGIRTWCDEHDKHLIAGGKDSISGSEDFYNTIFVVSPAGEIVFQQGKAQPIPFFNDGLPAKRQQVWESPWGRLGIAICYDMSYSRVMDPLINQDAQALIIPAVDVITWGEWEHKLHAKIVPVRAGEYGLPLFRLGSSGISTFVDSQGNTLAKAGYPGHGEILSARLPIQNSGRLPLDRYLALPMIFGMGVMFVLMLFVGSAVRTED